MERSSRTPRNAPHDRGFGKLAVAFACALALAGCGDDVTKNYYENPTSTVGSLNVSVTPSTASIQLSGPTGFTPQTFNGSKLIVDLAPGQYTAVASEPGYVGATHAINVVAGLTSSMNILLTSTSAPATTVGALNVNINPPSSTVVVTGPASYSETATGNHLYTGLVPGVYTASASAPGYVSSINSINVVAGQTSSISMILSAIPVPVVAPRAAYRDANGILVPINAASLVTGEFVFYAGLENVPLGINPAALTALTAADPGRPLLTEQDETAPSYTQNLGAAFVGYKDAAGVVRPVIGADVRWEIDQWWSGRVNSMQFGTSDDNRSALGYGVFDDQADTRTNNARLTAERFPLIASDYPFYNQSGIGTPFADGFTWVTLFSPDATASARIVLVAVVDGAEVGKQILYKNFAPAPQIEITKTVDTDILNLDVGDSVTWTVTVRNVGDGSATVVSLEDFLASGDGASYALSGLPADATPVGDGFTVSFPLDSVLAETPDQSTQLLGDAWSFAVLGSESITNVGATTISGNVGTSPGSSITGFESVTLTNGTIHLADGLVAAAQAAVTTAFVDLNARPENKPRNTALAGTLTPGVYKYDSSVGLTGSLILDALGDPAAEFVFQIGSTLTTASGSAVTLVNGASPCNVYWAVGSAATLGTGSAMVGNIIAQTAISMAGGASLSGRAMARTAEVTLNAIAIDAPLACVASAGSVRTLTFTGTVTAPGTYCNEAQILSYSDATRTWVPVALDDDACFTAVESEVSIVKDFVAADGTTSLGKALTVAKDVPARLRVRVVNSGVGDATGVEVLDALAAANDGYAITELDPATTANALDGFTTAPFDLVSGATQTYLFTVVGSADGTYCDTASVTAASGTVGNSSDTACLTVATAVLTMVKTESPTSVIPGGSYTSTIVVTNIGTATARNVVVSDLLGRDDVANVQVIYVSSSQDGVSGTLGIGTVTARTVDILAGQSMTFTVVSRIPLGAVSGYYCDTASVTSSNAAPVEPVDACVNVPAYAAIQTQLIDLADPIAVGSNVTYSSTFYVEALSNEGVENNEMTYSFGHLGAFVPGTEGDFDVLSTAVYLDSNPVRDPTTGYVTSDSGSPTAIRQVLGTDYTIVNSANGGQQVLTMAPTVVLHPNTALFIVHVVNVPAGTLANRLYNTSYLWTSTPESTPGTTFTTTKSEPTTVLP